MSFPHDIIDALAVLAASRDRPDRGDRLAAAIGADEAVLFLWEREVATALPAPGFAKTLPGGIAWRALIADCVKQPGVVCCGRLIPPRGLASSRAVAAMGCAASDHSVVVALGDRVRESALTEACLLVSLITPGLHNERIAERALADADAERRTASRAAHLVDAIDAARTHTERELRTTQSSWDSLRLVLREAPVAMAVLRGPDHVLEFANRRFEELFGRALPPGCRAAEVLPELAGQRVLALVDEASASHRATSYEEVPLRLTRSPREEETLHVSLGLTPIVRGDAVEGVICSIVDVTPIVVSRHHAQETLRAKDEFLAMVSHELRTPLSAVLGWATLLREGGLDQESLERALQAIERNARVQTRIIDDLLDLSRCAAGRLRISAEPVEVTSSVRAAVESSRVAAEAKHVTIELQLGVSSAIVAADPQRLQQIIGNLIANAIKFTPQGGTVRVELRLARGEIELVIEDTGSGIDPEFLPFVFEPFRQQDATSTRRHDGLGLGLAVVRGLVQLHGWTIEAHSEGIGRGASFVVVAPVGSPSPN